MGRNKQETLCSWLQLPGVGGLHQNKPSYFAFTFALHCKVSPMLALITLHWSAAGTYMCSPVLVPQMVGTVMLPGADTPKVSMWQVPWIVKAPALPVFPCIAPLALAVAAADIGYKKSY
jgi:hypothetical protein